MTILEPRAEYVRTQMKSWRLSACVAFIGSLCVAGVLKATPFISLETFVVFVAPFAFAVVTVILVYMHNVSVRGACLLFDSERFQYSSGMGMRTISYASIESAVLLKVGNELEESLSIISRRAKPLVIRGAAFSLDDVERELLAHGVKIDQSS